MRRSTGGFTMIEAVIAVAVLSVIIIATFAIVVTASEAYREGVTQAQVEEQDRRVIDLIANELCEARVMQVADDGCLLDIQVPVEVGGSIYGAGKQVNWGADSTLGYAFRYAAVSLSPPQVLDEVADQTDYNGDGTIQDDFERVWLRRSLLDGAGTEMAGGNLTRMLLVPSPPDPGTGLRPVLDMDGDGTLDPPFQRYSTSGVPSPTGSQVRVALWIQRTRDDGHDFVIGLTTKAFTRNTPE